MLLPEQIKSIDEQLKRLEGLNVSPEQQKAVRERWEKLKSQPVPDGPLRLRKYRNFRIPMGEARIPPSPPVLTMKQRVWRGEKYIPPVLTPEQEREKRAEVRWHAQKGLWDARQALKRVRTDQDRDRIQKSIRIYEEMLERNREK